MHCWHFIYGVYGKKKWHAKLLVQLSDDVTCMNCLPCLKMAIIIKGPLFQTGPTVVQWAERTPSKQKDSQFKDSLKRKTPTGSAPVTRLCSWVRWKPFPQKSLLWKHEKYRIKASHCRWTETFAVDWQTKGIMC